MDDNDQNLKKKFELDVIQNLIARCYDMATIQDERLKRTIVGEAETFYRDHIKDTYGADASHHNIEKRFPNLNAKMRAEVARFANEMAETHVIEEVEKLAAKYGVTRSVLNEKLKNFIASNRR